MKREVGELAQWVKNLLNQPEDLSLDPCAHVRAVYKCLWLYLSPHTPIYVKKTLRHHMFLLL